MSCREFEVDYRPVEIALTLMRSAIDLLESADRCEASDLVRRAVELVQPEPSGGG